MKITGAEFKEWYDNHWPSDPSPESFYIDDCFLETHKEDGSWLIANDQELDTDILGFIGWQGQGEDARHYDISVTGYIRRFRQWQKKQNVVFISWFVPKDKKEVAENWLKSLGGVQVLRQ